MAKKPYVKLRLIFYSKIKCLDMDICSSALLDRLEISSQLQDELLQLQQLAWLAHVNQRDYHGSWDVLVLRCAREYQTAHPILQAFSIAQADAWQDLAHFSACPAMLALVHSLKCPIKSVRLMRLHAGAHILPHRDLGLCVEHGEARLHLPLQTHDKLAFYVNNQQVPMQVGELWYINADQTHWVENKGNEARINLVIDCEVNNWLRDLVNAAQCRKSTAIRL